MLIFLWVLWPIVIPIAIGSIILAALGAFTFPAGTSALQLCNYLQCYFDYLSSLILSFFTFSFRAVLYYFFAK